MRMSASRLFALAVAVRIALWVALGAPQPIHDDQTAYLALRDGLAATGRLLDPLSGAPTAYRDPGYPLFLAGLARLGLGALPFLWLVQIVLSSLTGVLLFLTTRRAAGERVASILALLFLLHLSFATYGLMVYTETLFCFLASLFLCALARWRQAPGPGSQVLAGLVGAASVLTRASSLVGIAGIAAGSAMGAPRRWRAWALGLVVFALPLGLWTARNAAQVGVAALNSNAAINVYMGNNPRTPLVHSFKVLADSLAYVPLRQDPEAARARTAARLAREHVLAEPGRFAAAVLLRLPDALESDRILAGLTLRGQFPGRPSRFVLVCAALAALATAIPAVLCFAALLSPGPVWLAAAGRGAFLGFLVVQLVSFAHARFTLPAWILLLPGAALMAERLLRGERSARIATSAAAVILVLVWVRQIVLR